MTARDPLFRGSSVLDSQSSSYESLSSLAKSDNGGTKTRPDTPEYTREQLLSFAKCFEPDTPDKTTNNYSFFSLLGILIRFGILFPLRCIILALSTIGFFTALPISLSLKNQKMVTTCIQYYCKGLLYSLGITTNYQGSKPRLQEPHVFVANHTSYLDYILLSANQFPHAVVMAKHTGVLGFLQQNGLNYIHSLTFDRSNAMERKGLAESLKKHVNTAETWKNPMIIFPEGTCVNNKYTIRFQKGAFDLGVTVCPVGIKYDRYFGDPYWDTRKGFMHYAFYRMTRWITPVKITYCEPIQPIEGESAPDYGKRVRDVIASRIGLEKVDFNGMAKRDLLKALKEEKKKVQ